MSVTVDVDHLVDWWVHGDLELNRWLILDSISLEQAEDAVRLADAELGEDWTVGGNLEPFGESSAIRVLYFEHPDVIRRWLISLVAALDAAGCSGRMVADERPWGESVEASEMWSTPTAFFAWRLHDPPLALEDWRAHWGVDASLTAAVMRRAATWCLNSGGTIALEVGGGPASVLDRAQAGEGITRRLVEAIGGARFAVVEATPAGTGAGVRIGFGMGGISIMQLTGQADPGSVVRILRDELRDVASDLRWGAVRLTRAGRTNVADLYGAIGLPGGLTGGVQVARAGKLLNDWVPDANGVQIVQDAVLARLELTEERWVITPLGDGRSLVEARDLDPWLSGQRVPTAVLTEARREFEPAQLTADGLYEARCREPLI